MRFPDMILEKRKWKYFNISKSIMAAQKCQKKLLLTQNSTNQDSQLSWFFQTIWKAIRKSKNRGLYGIISACKWFQNLLCKTFDAYRPNNDVKFRPKSLSDPLHQMSSINYHNLFGCAINKNSIRNIHK